MSKKRLRIFAGPNGSGKSTFIDKVSQSPPVPSFKLGYYINADDIERVLKDSYCLDFNKYGIFVTTGIIRSYLRKSTFAPVRLNLPNLWQNFKVLNNELLVEKTLDINSYIAADLAEFIRITLLKSGLSFSYETVMSDPNKIAFLRKAKNKGYSIYLYFFATEDPEINISRVKVRTAQKGHFVKDETIRARYYKSLKNLKKAIYLSNRAYLFDNSNLSVLVSEITEGKNVTIIDTDNIPTWFYDYVIRTTSSTL